MNIPLEDGFTDIIAKAQRGLGISDGDLAEKSGLSADIIKAVKDGKVDPSALAKIAAPLGLGARALVNVAEAKYRPTVETPAGFAAFNSPYEDFTVNSYLVWDVNSRDAIVFDTGSDATELLQTIAKEGLKVHYILLTHTHGDHIFDLERVLEKTGAPALTPEEEPVEGAAHFVSGTKFHCGTFDVSSLLTNGHSPGGTTFFVEGLSSPLAIVGDSLFAGSMGGAANAWQLALANNREKILSLPGETVICPGHGPLTSVAQEIANNPFFSTASA